MQVRLMRLSFLSVLVFSELLDSCIIPCLSILRVCQRQLQMLYRLKRSRFSQNEIYHASEVVEVIVFKCASVQKSMFKHTSGCPETTANALATAESRCFLKMSFPIQVGLLSPGLSEMLVCQGLCPTTGVRGKAGPVHTPF